MKTPTIYLKNRAEKVAFVAYLKEFEKEHGINITKVFDNPLHGIHDDLVPLFYFDGSDIAWMYNLYQEIEFEFDFSKIEEFAQSILDCINNKQSLNKKYTIVYTDYQITNKGVISSIKHKYIEKRLNDPLEDILKAERLLDKNCVVFEAHCKVCN